MTTSLPTYDKVFFVHYQCQNFNLGEEIYNMCVCSGNKVKQYDGTNEVLMIEQYCQQVKTLCDEGFIPVHWNQNAKYYGIDHIIHRYTSLTDKVIELEYPNEIDLASTLIELYGDDYVPHSRLDSLANLNNLRGHSSENADRTFPTSRIQLISKIYHKAINGKLKVETNKQNVITESELPTMAGQPEKSEKKVKSFADFLIHCNKTVLATAIKKEFTTEKGKNMRLLIEAMKQSNPPMLSYCNGEGMALYKTLLDFFCHDIGSYNSIFGYDYKEADASDVEAKMVRLNFIIENMI